MTLTMMEACARLSCTPRQLRYRIKKEEVRARKVDGRWLIEERDLPPDPQRALAEASRAAELRQVVADASRLRQARRRYTVEDVHAFTDVVAVTRELVTRAPRHGAVEPLRLAAMHLARGVHEYGGGAKAGSFGAARISVADAIAMLHLDPVEPALVDLARRLEDAVLPALGGLLRRQARRE